MNDEYLAYLLRLKRNPGRPHWRASLENAHTGTVRHFASEKELYRFLIGRLSRPSSLADHDEGTDAGSNPD